MENKTTTSKRDEIEQFLIDVRAHFRASLETSEYENTSNPFHMTDAEQTVKLLSRCELLLSQIADKQAAPTPITSNWLDNCSGESKTATTSEASSDGTGCYLEMMSTRVSKNTLSASREYIDFASTGSVDSDKTFRCSSGQETMVSGETNEKGKQHQQLSDIYQSMDDDETQMVMAPTDPDLSQVIDCPYSDLPAGHLAIQRSTKYGQLQRIEKRLFFDQSKKYYCGIIDDWMLCYVDGPTSCRPTNTLYLKSSAIEIEHFGEGKRRDVCFQITTADPNKKFIYQASNEVDAKEWIHAIEAAIRGDAANANPATVSLKSTRRLPTPPVIKKCYQAAPTKADQVDCIYEEPSALYNYSEPVVTLPQLPEKTNSPCALAKRFEYDIPKCPPQPLTTNAETTGLLNMPDDTPAVEAKPQPSSLHGGLKLDFQAKVKTVHSELSSQLSPGGPSPERLKKGVKKTYSCGSSDGEMLSLTTANPKEQKKQRKTSAAQTSTSPQKSPSKDCDKLAKNWFLSRLNKTAGLATRGSMGTGTQGASTPSNAKCKQSEKWNLLDGLDLCDGHDPGAKTEQTSNNNSSNHPLTCLKAEAKSKVNMIVNQFESNGHLKSMFSVELASLTSLCDSDTCNNYEPIMQVSTPPSSFLKKV
ncbi:uncharacterized protein LOC115634523 [Scaptodrosophila lebanonensis]|uniref:Uncharacterized protein LOC115634523 n=1 Tax=Drosophila lebanonensis TaxID=7225 RepID=A0A6J2UIX4_DROLE|nr:uncharacterized protein LOC115634523 [Scaptodrosophila lebanonensis]